MFIKKINYIFKIYNKTPIFSKIKSCDINLYKIKYLISLYIGRVILY